MLVLGWVAGSDLVFGEGAHEAALLPRGHGLVLRADACQKRRPFEIRRLRSIRIVNAVQATPLVPCGCIHGRHPEYHTGIFMGDTPTILRVCV